MEILQYSPGQVVTVVLETFIISSNNDGYRHDGYSSIFGLADGYDIIDGYYNLPIVERVLFPSLAQAGGYPQKMVRITNGLYYFNFTLPTGANAIGTYIVDINYVSPGTTNIAQKAYQIVVIAPYGQYSIGTF